MYRGALSSLEVFLVHPGGPFFAKKDLGAWSIPKGLVEPGEVPIQTARREFSEEVGLPAPDELIPLGEIVQKGGKRVLAWAFAGDTPPEFQVASNLFELEWPPRSGRRRSFPEIDKAEFFGVTEARQKILPAQEPFIDRLLAVLAESP